jgi:hypothetical protein
MKRAYQLESSLSSPQPEDDSALELVTAQHKEGDTLLNKQPNDPVCVKDEVSSTCRLIATDREQGNQLVRLRKNNDILVFRGRRTGQVSTSMA